MTEEQRRALFALREALFLCVAQRVEITIVDSLLICVPGLPEFAVGVYLSDSDINDLLEAHPE